MAKLTKIEVTITTGKMQDAGTDGSVYLGVCGREFHCDTGADDFERGSTRTYIFGRGANVKDAVNNDPRKPPISLENQNLFPVYIRFEPGTGGSSAWNLQRATVNLNESTIADWETFLHQDEKGNFHEEGLWLGINKGQFVFLGKPIEIPF